MADAFVPVIPQICSEPEGDYVRVRFFNLTGTDGKVSRVKEDCEEEFVLDLNSTERPFQDSFVGEVWSFRSDEGVELSRVRVEDVLTVRVDFEVPE